MSVCFDHAGRDSERLTVRKNSFNINLFKIAEMDFYAVPEGH